MHSKVSINVVSADVNVIPKYSRPLMHIHKIQITRLVDLHVGGKSIGTVMLHNTGHRDIRFLVSVIKPDVVGARLP